MCNLLPCPFCGGKPNLKEYITRDGVRGCTIECFNCGIIIGDRKRGNHNATAEEVKKLAIANWNNRTENAEFKKYKEEAAVELFDRRTKIIKLTRQLEQREDFIRDIFYELKNSNSKSTLVNVLLSRCEAQINSQMLGVI